MPRMYVLNSWVGAAEYDEGDTYSGEQIGNRNQRSVEVPIHRSGDQWRTGGHTVTPECWVNGKPNIAAFADKEAQPKKKQAAAKPIREKICPQYYTLNKLDTQEAELLEAYENEEIEYDEFTELMSALDAKRERAFKSLSRALNMQENDDNTEEVGLLRVGRERLFYGRNTPRNTCNPPINHIALIKNIVRSDVFKFLTGSIAFVIVALLIA